jgi:hypothetical protein
MKKGSIPRGILVILAIAAVIVAAALVTGSLPLQKNPVPAPAAVTTPAPVNTPPVAVATATTPVTAHPPPSTAPAPASVPAPARKITDGFWCRDTTINIGKAPTSVKECYQFFVDGTYKWGYTPGWPMGKSLSCSGSPDVQCEYSLRPDGKIEVQGGYSYTVSGDALIDPHDPPYFIWTATGIP